MSTASRFASAVLAAASCLALGCEEAVDDYTTTGNTSYLLPGGGAEVVYTVDSVIYDPAAGGTDRSQSRHTWTLDLGDHRAGEPYTVRISDTSGITSALFWSWDALSDPPRSLNTLSGLPIIGLKVPFDLATTWDPLVFANRSEVLSVASEPLAVFKDWTRARVDSIGTYSLADGEEVAAVWVTLADAENLLELREWREVYGAGYGLLERHVRILDTQVTDASVPWEERAERGFQVTLVRQF